MAPKKAQDAGAGKRKRSTRRKDDDSDASFDDAADNAQTPSKGKKRARTTKKAASDDDAPFEDFADDAQDGDGPEDGEEVDDAFPGPKKKASKPRSGRAPKKAEEQDREKDTARSRRDGANQSKERAREFIENNIPPELIQSKQTMPDSINTDFGYMLETFLAWAQAGNPDLNGVQQGPTIAPPTVDEATQTPAPSSAMPPPPPPPPSSTIPTRPYDPDFVPRATGGSYVAQNHFHTRGRYIPPARPFQVDMQPYLQWVEQNHIRFQQQAVDALRAVKGQSAEEVETIINAAADGLMEAGDKLKRLNQGSAEQYEPTETDQAPAVPEEDGGDVVEGDGDDDAVAAPTTAADGDADIDATDEDDTDIDEMPPPRASRNRGRGGRGRGRGRGAERGRGRGGRSRQSKGT